MRLHKSYKDGVNSLSAAKSQAVHSRVWPRSLGPAIYDDTSNRRLGCSVWLALLGRLPGLLRHLVTCQAAIDIARWKACPVP
jgi:hypothetical protein